MRTLPSELPEQEELIKILSYEAVREIIDSKKDIHYADFSTIIDILKNFNLPTSFFDTPFSLEDLKDEEFFENLNKVFADTATCIKQNSDHESVELYNRLYEYLSAEDSIENSDLIFVFGSKSTFRIEKAVKLYKQGAAKKIMISGKSASFVTDALAITEAEILAEHAIKNGVLKEDLILETDSVTMPGNVKRSLNLLDAINFKPKKVILINSPFAQMRGWVLFNKYSYDDCEYIKVNTDTVSPQYSKNGWYLSEEGIAVILKELFSLRLSDCILTA